MAGGKIDDGFATALRSWRRLNNFSQAQLANDLGVSQPAIARWEKGLDVPEASRLARLRNMMASSMRDEMALDRLFTERQSAVRALFDFDQMRMLANSQGFRSLWPDSSLLLDRPMRDHLVNEADHITNDPETRREILAGSLGLISGVSERQIDLQIDTAIRHAWHICFRRVGPKIIADMVYEPCALKAEAGIKEMVRLDNFSSI